MDSIADMLTRIKNALRAGHQQVVMPHSKLRAAIAQILVDEGYLKSLEVIKKEPQADLKLVLKYIDNTPAISQIKRVSKPGRRLYTSSQNIPASLGGYGLTILSTNQGVICDREARKKNVGGEILCQIW